MPEIVFPEEKYCINDKTFGVNFQALVDGAPIVCQIGKETLQDINPKNRMDDTTSLFLQNRQRIEECARNLITMGGNIVDGNKLSIFSQDLQAM